MVRAAARSAPWADQTSLDAPPAETFEWRLPGSPVESVFVPPAHRIHRGNSLAVMLLAMAVLAGCATFASRASAVMSYPVGIPSAPQPSSLAPPGHHSLAGYREVYVNNFNGSGLPPGWIAFSGHPGGLPTVNFSVKHVVVSHGLLQLKTYRDPAYANAWTIGGLCQCGRFSLYGAYFVRSRITAGGANTAELLWPHDNQWPPEIDFNENLNHLALTSSTTHWSPGNQEDFTTLRIDMLQWHTWGVIWTPTYILFVVDGQVWHRLTVTSEIPNIPMVLDFEQRAVCPSSWECPSGPSALLIDWVAEYEPN